jgi:MarR family transcriptional regulator, organic hydroperoxide resistance regulator
MQALFRAEGLSLKELSREVGPAHSTVSGVVDRLEKRRLALRRPDPDDDRFTRITVSEPVRKQGREMLAVLALRPLAEALNLATPAERTQTREALSTLRRLPET